MKVEVVSAENVLGGRNQVQHRLFGGVLLLHWSEDQTNMFQIPVTSVLGKQVSPRLLSGGGCCWSVEEQSVSTFPSLFINNDDVGGKKISVLSFKTCWTILTKKVTTKAGSPEIQPDRWAEEEKEVKKWTFQIPLAQIVPLIDVILAVQCFAVPRAQLLPSTHYNRI